jgi:outer membrane protein assembly factor BamB
MSYDGEVIFKYTGSVQKWKKPIGVTSVFFFVRGAGGGGNISASGGGGAYVFANYSYLLRNIEYEVIINIGSGGKSPLSSNLSSGGSGGISIGGQHNNNGGDGSSFNNLQSGGGGGMTNVLYVDLCGNKVIEIIAGGGGGAGINKGANGGNGGQIGQTGLGVGGGKGGNIELNGNSGIGGLIGGANGYNYVDSSLNGTYIFLGGGGGYGGSFAGGGGGAGFGGGAGGNQGDGGGGGGSYSLKSINTFTTGGGGSGGDLTQDGTNGSVSILYNFTILQQPIVEMFMLNAQHTCQSIYPSAIILPIAANIYKSQSKTFPNSAVIDVNRKLYIIDGDGLLYSFNSNFTPRLSVPFSAPLTCTFIGTPAINGDRILYIASTSTTTQNYLFAVNDNGPGLTGTIVVKWQYLLDGNSSVSPILDLNQNIYIATDKGSIYAIQDNGSYGLPLWIYSSSDKNPITGTPGWDLTYKQLFYTTSSNVSSTLFAIDVSGTQVTQRWKKLFTNEICGTPVIENNKVYVITNTMNTNNGTVYAFDISGGNNIWSPCNIVGNTRAKNIAIDNVNNYIYATSQGNLYVINLLSGTQFWTYNSGNTSTQYTNTIPIIDSNQNVLFGGGIDTRFTFLYSVNPLNQKLNWKYPTSGAVQCMPIIGSDGHIYFGASDGKIYDLSGNGSLPIPTSPAIVPMYMLNPQHTSQSPYSAANILPTTVKTQSTNSVTFPNSAVITSDALNNKLYIIDGDGLLYAFNADFTPRWSKPFDASFNCKFIGTPAIAGNGTLYIAASTTTQNFLFAVKDTIGTGDARTGTANITWKLELDGTAGLSPILDPSGTIYIGTNAGSINAIIDIGDQGLLLWSYGSPDRQAIAGTPALNLTNDQLYYTTTTDASSALFSLNLIPLTPPSQRWTHPFPNEICGTPSVDKNNNVYVITTITHSSEGNIYTFDPSGSQRWVTTPVLDSTKTKNIAIDNVNNYIYFTSVGDLYVIDMTDGAEVWNYFTGITGAPGRSTIPIIDANNNIYFSTGMNNKLYCVNAVFRTLNWQYETSGIIESMPIIGNNGHIYFGANDGKIYDLSGNINVRKKSIIPSQITVNIPPVIPPPSVSPIVPMYLLDAQHTNTSPFTFPLTQPNSVIFKSQSSTFPYSASISADNKLYIIAGDGILYTFNANFTLRRMVTAPTPFTFTGTPAITSTGILCISTSQNKIFGITDTVDANFNWQRTLDGNVTGSPLIDSTDTIYVGTANGTARLGSIYAINAIDGLIRWLFPSPDGNNILGIPVLNKAQNILFYTTRTPSIPSNPAFVSTSLYSIQLNGVNLPSQKWNYNFQDIPNEVCNIPVIDNSDNVYIATKASGVGVFRNKGDYIFDTNGSVINKYAYPGYDDDDVTKYAGYNNNTLFTFFQKDYRITRINGKYLTTDSFVFYETNTSYDIDGYNLIYLNPLNLFLDKNGIIYASGANDFPDVGNNYIHSLLQTQPYADKRFGVLRQNWKYRAGGVIQAIPIIDNNGNMFFGADDGNIYNLISNPTTQLVNVPGIIDTTQHFPITATAPMSMLNAKHTGKSNFSRSSLLPPSAVKIFMDPALDYVSGNLFISPAIAIGGDGTLYVGSRDGILYALDPLAANTVKWRVVLGEVNNSSSTNIFPKALYTTPAIGYDGTIYVVSNESIFYALDPMGNIKWNVPLGAISSQSSPVLDNNGSIYVCGGSNIITIGDAGNEGYVKWFNTLNTGTMCNCSPAVGDFYTYVAADDGWVYAMDSIDGNAIWRFNTGLPILSSATVDISNNVIIGNGSHTDGTLYYLDGIKPLAENNPARVIWSWPPTVPDLFDYRQRGPLNNPVAINGNTIYLSTLGYVYAINRLTGATRYKFAKANAYYSSPIIDAIGTIYVTSINTRTSRGILHSLTDTGTQLRENWQLDVDPSTPNSRFSPPALDKNGKLYISSTGNKIYAI